MKILIMGSGAVGGYFGAVLHRGGHDVMFVARGTHLDAIRQQGLRIESATSGNFTVRPTATDRPDGSWIADFVLFCVKGYDNPGAMATMAPAVGEETSVLTVQNGIRAGEELASAFGRDRVLLGLTYVDAVRKGPGHVVQLNAPTRIVVGEEDGSQSQRAIAVRDALQDAGITVELSSHVGMEMWKKLIFICGLSGVTCVTRATIAEVLDTRETRQLLIAVMSEAAAVAVARGVQLDPTYVDDTVAYFEKNRESLVSSMFVDLEQGNLLEVEILNGAISRSGRELGVPTPANDFITSSLMVAHNRAMARRG